MVVSEILWVNSSRTILGWIRSFFVEKGKSGEEQDKTNKAEKRQLERRRKECERILKEQGNSILRLSFSYLKDISKAEDALQDTLLRYIQKAPEFKSIEHRNAWIMRVAINICKNKLKKEKKRSYFIIENDLIDNQGDDLSYVWEAVGNLPVKYREVIHLFYHDGYSTEQIANILDKKDSTVRSLLHRGRKTLRNILKEGYDFEE